MVTAELLAQSALDSGRSRVGVFKIHVYLSQDFLHGRVVVRVLVSGVVVKELKFSSLY